MINQSLTDVNHQRHDAETSSGRNSVGALSTLQGHETPKKDLESVSKSPLCIDSDGDMKIYGTPDVVLCRCEPAKSPSLYQTLTPSPPPSPPLSPPPSPATIPTYPFHEFPPDSVEYYTGRVREFVRVQDLSPTTLPTRLWNPRADLSPTRNFFSRSLYSSGWSLDSSTILLHQCS
ncbi:hypothetical protein HA466_0072380 [Hirschfeldia incana]|nr:hypothetical protein HA466_0072380 [Hirschfeldia incana]